MSTGNCIVDGPQSPSNTLNAVLKVSQGQGLILRHLATMPVTFDATLGLSTQDFSLGGARSIVLSRGSAGLIISTTAPLTVTTTQTVVGGQSTITNTITVNSILILDADYSSIVIANPNASGTADITGQLIYVPYVAA